MPRKSELYHSVAEVGFLLQPGLPHQGNLEGSASWVREHDGGSSRVVSAVSATVSASVSAALSAPVSAAVSAAVSATVPAVPADSSGYARLRVVSTSAASTVCTTPVDCSTPYSSATSVFRWSVFFSTRRGLHYALSFYPGSPRCRIRYR